MAEEWSILGEWKKNKELWENDHSEDVENKKASRMRMKEHPTIYIYENGSSCKTIMDE